MKCIRGENFILYWYTFFVFCKTFRDHFLCTSENFTNVRTGVTGSIKLDENSAPPGTHDEEFKPFFESTSYWRTILAQITLITLYAIRCPNIVNQRNLRTNHSCNKLLLIIYGTWTGSSSHTKRMIIRHIVWCIQKSSVIEDMRILEILRWKQHYRRNSKMCGFVDFPNTKLQYSTRLRRAYLVITLNEPCIGHDISAFGNFYFFAWS